MITTNNSDWQKIITGGKILAEILEKTKELVKPGISLKELDVFTYNEIKKRNTIPAFLGYKSHPNESPYPATICASINETIVHGIPNNYIIKDSDLVKIDMGLIYEKFYLDSATSINMDKNNKEVDKLLEVTKKALLLSIKECTIDKKLGDIGYIIHKTAKDNNLNICEGLTGHGIGYNLHEDPYVFNFGKKNTGEKIKPGMILAIEPMFTTGSGKTKYFKDGSFKTKDNKPSSHFEHTIIITKEEPIIATCL